MVIGSFKLIALPKGQLQSLGFHVFKVGTSGFCFSLNLLFRRCWRSSF